MSLSSLVTYQKYVRDGTKLEQKFESSAEIKKDVDYATKALDKVTSVDDVFKDTRLVKFLAKALNLSGEEQYPGKMRRILSEKVDNKDAVMYRLSDKRYAQAADKLRLGDSGVSRLKLAGTQTDLIDAYKKAKFEDSIGTENLAVRQARYFEQYAGNAKSPYNILGDPILREVVTSTLGLPKQIAIQPVETQAKAISDKIDVTKFSDAKYRENFIKRFLNQNDIANAGTDGGSNSWMLSLLGGGTSTTGGVNLLV
ncbi:DUF1217 domain-containing protein [Azospirillum sp. sgz301742]